MQLYFIKSDFGVLKTGVVKRLTEVWDLCQFVVYQWFSDGLLVHQLLNFKGYNLYNVNISGKVQVKFAWNQGPMRVGRYVMKIS